MHRAPLLSLELPNIALDILCCSLGSYSRQALIHRPLFHLSLLFYFSSNFSADKPYDYCLAPMTVLLSLRPSFCSFPKPLCFWGFPQAITNQMEWNKGKCWIQHLQQGNPGGCIDWGGSKRLGEALQKGTQAPGQWQAKCASAVPWQPGGPSLSWGASGTVSPAGQGRGLSCSALPCSALLWGGITLVLESPQMRSTKTGLKEMACSWVRGGLGRVSGKSF